MVTLIQLEYIIAVDTYRHFVTASEHCFVTQPTLSMQIKKMEEDLGIIIFDRSKKPIIPTEIGKEIIEQARIVLSESKKMKEIIKSYNDTVSGEISIGIIPSLAPYLLPLFIGSFTRNYPEVKVKVHELITEDIIKHLKNDTIDVGIAVTPIHETAIIERTLFYEEMLIYINKNHEFASQKNINPKDLASPDLWLLQSGHCFRSQVLNLCDYKSKREDNYHFQYESGSLETIKKIVSIEGGYTLLPELAIENEKSNSQINIKKFTDSTPLREVSLIFTRNYVKKKLLDLLSIEIKQSIPSSLLDKTRGQVIEWK